MAVGRTAACPPKRVKICWGSGETGRHIQRTYSQRPARSPIGSLRVKQRTSGYGLCLSPAPCRTHYTANYAHTWTILMERARHPPSRVLSRLYSLHALSVSPPNALHDLSSSRARVALPSYHLRVSCTSSWVDPKSFFLRSIVSRMASHLVRG